MRGWTRSPTILRLLVERFVEAKEIAVGILDGRVLGAIEIAPAGGVYDYQAKYTPGLTEYFMPARLPPTRYRGVLNLAERAAQALACTAPCASTCSSPRARTNTSSK